MSTEGEVAHNPATLDLWAPDEETDDSDAVTYDLDAARRRIRGGRRRVRSDDDGRLIFRL